VLSARTRVLAREFVRQRHCHPGAASARISPHLQFVRRIGVGVQEATATDS